MVPPVVSESLRGQWGVVSANYSRVNGEVVSESIWGRFGSCFRITRESYGSGGGGGGGPDPSRVTGKWYLNHSILYCMMYHHNY